MRLLLDTNAFLWSLAAPWRLGAIAAEAMTDPSNELLLSIVAAWEIAIKLSLGKLRMPGNAAGWLPRELPRRGLRLLHIELEHALAVEHLPRHHRDPFDRLLIAQAQAERLTIITADEKFRAYDVPVMWT